MNPRCLFQPTLFCDSVKSLVSMPGRFLFIDVLEVLISFSEADCYQTSSHGFWTPDYNQVYFLHFVMLPWCFCTGYLPANYSYFVLAQCFSLLRSVQGCEFRISETGKKNVSYIALVKTVCNHIYTACFLGVNVTWVLLKTRIWTVFQ